MNELKDIDIHIISLVDKGANRKNIIWKSDSSTKYVHTSSIEPLIPIVKTDEAKRIVYGIVYSPNEEDAHGDFATEKEIEKACYNFMKKSKTSAVDTQHDLDTNKDCFIGESWIVKANDAFFPQEVGAWAVGIKVENDEIWKSVTSGEFTGISMYGYADKVQKSEDDKIEKGIMNFFRKFFTSESGIEDQENIAKDFNDRIIMLDFPKLLDALYSAAYDVLYDENITDKTAGILECVDQFKTHLAGIETSKSICKAGKMVSDSNMKKLRTAMESIQGILDAAEKSTEKRAEYKLNKSLNNKGESEMTPEEIIKQIDDAVKPLSEANETLKTENADLKKRLEDIEKKSKGSSQVHGTGDPEKEVKKSEVFPWATCGA